MSDGSLTISQILVPLCFCLGASNACGSADSRMPSVDGAMPERGMSPGPDSVLADAVAGEGEVAGDSQPYDAVPDGVIMRDAQTNDATVADADGTLPDGPHACHNNNDCAASAGGPFCSPGGAPVGCGACQAPQAPCNMDSECQQIHDSGMPAAMVCGPAGPCACPSPGKSGSCIPACAAVFDCSPGLVCQSGHCSARTCSTDTDCPPVGIQDYECATGHCAPKPCASDADCHGGYCINGACATQPGACAQGAA